MTGERFWMGTQGTGGWATFTPLIGGWSDEVVTLTAGDGGEPTGVTLVATARPTTADAASAPTGPGVFALRWFECAIGDAEEFVSLSAAAWPAFEAANEGTRIFGLFQAVEAAEGRARFLLCTRYPSLAGWETSRADTRSPEFRHRAQLTRRTQVTLWRLQ